MMRSMTKWIATAGFALAGALSATAALAQCAGFIDVPPGGQFCQNVEWVKNRSITLGCTSTTEYCPSANVSRLQMAAFMNRLGTALTPIQLRVDASPGAVDLDTSVVVCQTAPQLIDKFPRRAYIDLSMNANAAADVGFAADVVVTTNGGGVWTPLNAVTNRASVGANQWASVSDVAFGDLTVGDTVAWGVRMTRGGIAGSADLADSRCQLRVLLFSRDGTVSPF